MNKATSVTAADAELVQALKKRQQGRSISEVMPSEVKESVDYICRLPAESRTLLDQWAFSQMSGLNFEQQAAVRYLLDRAFAFTVEEEADHKMLLQAMGTFTQSRRVNALEKLKPARTGSEKKRHRQLEIALEVMRSHDRNPSGWAEVVMRKCGVSEETKLSLPTAYRRLKEAKAMLSQRASP